MALKQIKISLDDEKVFLLDREIGRNSRSEVFRTLLDNELIRRGVLIDEQK